MAKKILVCAVALIVLAAIGSYVWRLESQNADLKDRIECLKNRADGALRIEIDRCMLRTAYEREKEDFDVAHGMMGGGRISYAMLCNAKADFDNRWKRIVGDWFVSTARSEDERKLMREYGVGVADLKYERAELVAVMRGWESVRGSRGMFLGNDLTFTNGVAKFYDNRFDWSSVGCPNGLPKEIRLLKEEHIWIHGGNVFLFFATDIAQNFEDGYAGTDSEREIWFARFKDGLLKNYAPFRRGCGDWSDLRFHFEPDNDTIVITSTLSGNIAGGLGLGLREYTDVTTGKKSSQFGPSYTMVKDGDRRADASEPMEPNVNTNSPVAQPDATPKGR